MLAQSFLSADDLELSERQRDALIKTLVLLETGKLTHVDPNDISISFELYDYTNYKFSGTSIWQCGTNTPAAGQLLDHLGSATDTRGGI